MSKHLSIFDNQGVLSVPQVINQNRLNELASLCEETVFNTVGSRNLLAFDWVRDFAHELRQHVVIKELLIGKSKVIQCNYFSKDMDNNWYVTLHRDLSIPVAEKINSARWHGWSCKEGQLYAQPPRSVLESLIAIRIHFEDNDENNGALQVVPTSHRKDVTDVEPEIFCLKAGDALIFSPLALHRSSKLKNGKRRVLHFVFGPQSLPDGASWPSWTER